LSLYIFNPLAGYIYAVSTHQLDLCRLTIQDINLISTKGWLDSSWHRVFKFNSSVNTRT